MNIACIRLIRLATILALAMPAMVIAAPGPAHAGIGPTSPATDMPALDLRRMTDLSGIAPNLVKSRAVVVGESHGDYAHHLMQLEIIKAVHKLHPKMAIGLEMFQHPFQAVLDQYIKGDIDETTMLERTEYFKRWRFDYRLYAPILRYAREHGIPLIALNLPKEITDQVSAGGLESLDKEQKSRLPKLDRRNRRYDERIGAAFANHPGAEKKDLQRFRDIQLLWDESMARNAANYLNRHPSTNMVILAGSGHVIDRDGIPDRLESRIHDRPVTVLAADAAPIEPGIADYLLFPPEDQLARAGLMGISLEPLPKGGMKIVGFSKDSSGKAAGIRQGDILVNINGREIRDMQDVRLAMWDKGIGERVSVELRHGDRPRLKWLKVELR